MAAARKETALVRKRRQYGVSSKYPFLSGRTSCGNEGESKRGGGPDPILTDRLPVQFESLFKALRQANWGTRQRLA